MLRDAHALLHKVAPFLESVFTPSEMTLLMHPTRSDHPRSAVIVDTHAEICSDDVDSIDEECRQSSIAIRGSDAVASALDLATARPPNAAVISISQVSKLELYFERGQHRLLLHSITQNGRNQHTYMLDESDVAHTNTLFTTPATLAPPDAIPVVALPCKRQRDDVVRPDSYELPAWMSQRVGQLLQDGFRLHTVLSAATPAASRPVVLENAVLTLDEKRGCRIDARVHKSSATCICSVYQTPPTEPPTYVTVSFSFCGRRYGSSCNGRCPAHAECVPNFHSAFPSTCLHRMRTHLCCKHVGRSCCGLRLELDIPEESVEALRTLAAASVHLANTTEDAEALRVKTIIDDVLSDSDARHEPHSIKQINRDIRAVKLLRAGNVKRSFRKGVPSLVGQGLASADRDLRHSHVHLFKKRICK